MWFSIIICSFHWRNLIHYPWVFPSTFTVSSITYFVTLTLIISLRTSRDLFINSRFIPCSCPVEDSSFDHGRSLVSYQTLNPTKLNTIKSEKLRLSLRMIESVLLTRALSQGSSYGHISINHITWYSSATCPRHNEGRLDPFLLLKPVRDHNWSYVPIWLGSGVGSG